MTFVATILAAAAEAPANEFGYLDGDPTPWWQALTLVGLICLVFLPVPLAFVWVLRRFKLDRWILLNSTLVAFSPIVAFLLIRFYNLNYHAGLELAVEELIPEDDPTFLAAIVALYVVSWAESALLGRWLKRRARSEFPIEAFE